MTDFSGLIETIEKMWTRMNAMEATLAVGITLLIVVAIISATVETGREKYGLSFFGSASFALLFCGAILFLIGNITAGELVAGKTLILVREEMAPLLVVIFTGALALLANVWRTNVLFGIFYTALQALCLYSIVIGIVLFIILLFFGGGAVAALRKEEEGNRRWRRLNGME